MPGEEKDAKSEDEEKKSSNPKKGGSKSKSSKKTPSRPPKSKKGGKTGGTKETEKKVPESEEGEHVSKNGEKEDKEPSEPEKEAESTQMEAQKPPESEDAGTFSEEGLKTFITAYIDSYMDYVEEQNIKEGDYPLLYAYYPLDVTGYILPDESTCILFRGLASATNIAIERADFGAVDSEVADKRYDYICCYPPSFPYTREEAEKQARRDVDGDIEHSKQLGTVKADRAAKDETLKSIRLLFAAMPWVAQRKGGEGSLKFPQVKDEEELSEKALGMKEDEYFPGYSDRINRFENALLHGTKISQEPQEEEEKEHEETKPAPASEPAAPVAAAAAAPGTHVTVEIKQPEAPAKGEMYKERTEEDILRIKKTLYIQSRDIEELRRLNDELSDKLGNLEQMRQTVFRVNRKVFDSDSKMGRLEKSNMDILRRFAEFRAEQAEQNKKMRRFIAERAKKARNQAMALAGIALAVGMAALALLIMGIDLQELLGI